MVYLVDDDIDDIELVQEALIRKNYPGEIAVANDGASLMKNLLEPGDKRPDVIILDLNMPLKSGFQVLEELKLNPDLRSIPVVVLTASSSESDEVKCFQLGCELFWRKPTSMKEYDSLVDVLLTHLK